MSYRESLTTEALQAGSMHEAQAHELLKLDTVERRMRALDNAHILQNLRGGNLSGNLYDTVKTIQHLADTGREDEETYAERVVRQDLERQREAREARLQAAVRSAGLK